MNLVSASQTDDLQSEIKRRFTEFNKTNSPSKGRRYPSDLMALVCAAHAQGLKLATLCRLTGLSSSGIRRWVSTAVTKPVLARRLSVVDTNPKASLTAGMVIRLPSGIAIELTDMHALNGELLGLLNSLEVHHAASR